MLVNILCDAADVSLQSYDYFDWFISAFYLGHGKLTGDEAISVRQSAATGKWINRYQIIKELLFSILGYNNN